MWPASWLAAVEKSRSSRDLVRFKDAWQLLMSGCSLRRLAIERSINSGGVHNAWLCWSWAAESALVSAYVESGGPIPGSGLVRGRGHAWFRSVALGGPNVHRFRTDMAEPFSATEVHVYMTILLYICLILSVGSRPFMIFLVVMGGMASHSPEAWSLVLSGTASCDMALLVPYVGRIWMLVLRLG